MSRGYADSVELFLVWRWHQWQRRWHERTNLDARPQRAAGKTVYLPKNLQQLLDEPGPVFKGDRVLFIKEYRRKKPSDQSELEDRGQGRLID